MIDAIYPTEVYGSGPYAPPEPHLLLLPNDGITFRMSLGNKALWDSPARTRGTHQKDGVLYAYGKGFKQGFQAWASHSPTSSTVACSTSCSWKSCRLPPLAVLVVN